MSGVSPSRPPRGGGGRRGLASRGQDDRGQDDRGQIDRGESANGRTPPGEATRGRSDRTRTTRNQANRGQVQTLEAITAVFILFGGVAFALQVTAVTPLTASTASQHIENQQAGIATGLLDAAAENGTLQSTVLYWNESGSRYHGSGEDGAYSSGAPPTTFGEQLNETFLERGIAFDLTIHYVSRTSSDRLSRKSVDVVNLGVASDNAVSASRMVTIYDDDELFDATETETGTTVESGSPLNIKRDHAPDSPIWNVLEVEVTLWRM